MQFLKSKLHQLYLNESLRRVFHTFWQVAGGALVAGLLAAHSTADVKLALTGALATGLAAVKALYLTVNKE